MTAPTQHTPDELAYQLSVNIIAHVITGGWVTPEVAAKALTLAEERFPQLWSRSEWNHNYWLKS